MALHPDVEQEWIHAVHVYVSRSHPRPTKVVDIYPSAGNLKRQAKKLAIRDPGKEVTRLAREMVDDDYLEEVTAKPFQVRLGKRPLPADPEKTADAVRANQSKDLVTSINDKTRIMWCILKTPENVAVFRQYDPEKAKVIEDDLCELLEAQYGDTLPAGIAQRMEMYNLDGICGAFGLDPDADHSYAPTVGDTFKKVETEARERAREIKARRLAKA